MKSQNLVMKDRMEVLSKSDSSFAGNKRREAFNIFMSAPMPTAREEGWRYTGIEKLDLQKFSPFEGKAKISAVKLNEDLAQKGVILSDISTALEKYPIAQKHYLKNIERAWLGRNKLAALNAAFFTNGIFLHVPENIEVGKPISVNFHFEGQSSILHNIIIAGQNSRVSFIENYSNIGNKNANQEQLNSCITEIFASENSKINFCHLNNWTENAYSFTNIAAALERDASLNLASGCFGGRLNRLKIDTSLNGQGSQCSNIAVLFGREKENIDFTANACHNAQSTANNILVDGILKGESTATSRGLIKIERQGQKANSYFASHILKLGNKTLANSIPSLKIDANDVKASHESTIGQIDEEHLFYLMSRGVQRHEAERLIVEGFFEPAIQKMPLEEAKEMIRQMVKK